jgi:hypothetical protein
VAIARHRRSKHVSVITDDTTINDTVSSMQSVPSSYNEGQLASQLVNSQLEVAIGGWQS